MKFLTSFLLAGSTLFVLGSCTHRATNPQGMVAMKISESETHITLGSGEVSEGDKVIFLRNICRDRPRAGSEYNHIRCRKVPVGQGTVTKVFNEDYAAVRPDEGITVPENGIVQKAIRKTTLGE